ncbi:hypothetical protein Y1Q_0018968 [Alligator mississippiensis]|uniref:Uncharacterized protein n=1 Tax=Alligator mississippiensis TaxID=8496 RepID=A0A151M3B3_ALLMI|nr:hypothetical protein Y1Q_0018968 [Alligator mississippiensis]
MDPCFIQSSEWTYSKDGLGLNMITHHHLHIQKHPSIDITEQLDTSLAPSGPDPQAAGTSQNCSAEFKFFLWA